MGTGTRQPAQMFNLFSFKMAVNIMAEQLKNFKEDRYIAGMLLSGVGDALGYKNGYWEFCQDGDVIHRELKRLHGLQNLDVKLPWWRVSDDTVMHLATAEALIENGQNRDKCSLYQSIAIHYITSMEDMEDRSPGITCQDMCHKLDPANVPQGLHIPFNPRGGGCGAAMRSMCIGFRYPRACDLDDLIAVSIESGRLTHHHPTGFLGSLASALFTSYAVQGKPVTEWGIGLLKTLDKADLYIANKLEIEPFYTDQDSIIKNTENSDYFRSKWEFYLRLRNIADGKLEPRYAPDENIVQKRDQFYRLMSFDDMGGASGHDAPMIAYDALLKSNKNWTELCNRGMFHGGDSDSTGVIAGCLYGILYGIGNVPYCNYENLEYCDKLRDAGKNLFDLVNTENNESAFKSKNLPDNGNASSFTASSENEKKSDDHTGDETTTSVQKIIHDQSMMTSSQYKGMITMKVLSVVIQMALLVYLKTHQIYLRE